MGGMTKPKGAAKCKMVTRNGKRTKMCWDKHGKIVSPGGKKKKRR